MPRKIISTVTYHFIMICGSDLMPPRQNSSMLLQVWTPKKQTLRHTLHPRDLLGSLLRIKSRGGDKKEREGKGKGRKEVG